MNSFAMKIIGTIVVLFGLIVSASARDFTCYGQTHSGDNVSLQGSFDGYEVSDVRLYKNREIIYYWYGFNTDVNYSNTFWTLVGLEDGFSFVILHPQGQIEKTYIRIYAGRNADHEFQRATCQFFDY